MPTPTYNCIATTTTTSAVSAVTFSSISGSYTDLVLIVTQSAPNTTNHGVRLNNDTNFNYSTTAVFGTGSSAGTERKTTSSGDGGRRSFIWTNNGSTAIGNSVIHIMNYSNATTYKTVLSRGNMINNVLMASAGLWHNTSAVTSVTYSASDSTVDSGSTFSLYGIKAE